MRINTMDKENIKFSLLGLFILIALLCSIGIIYQAEISSTTETEDHIIVHISYDDVYLVLNELIENQETYSSIFQCHEFSALKYLHEQYGVIFTLYVYEKVGDYSISNVPVKYKDEFNANSDWLKFGYHGISPEYPIFNESISLEQFRTSYNTVKDAIYSFAGEDSYSNVVRLSYFSGTNDMVSYLQAQGIFILLCADDGRISYNLNENESKLLSLNGVYYKNNITYLKTDMRYENCKGIIIRLNSQSIETPLVLFTHEWAFEETYSDVAKSIYWMKKHKYIFSDLNDLSLYGELNYG